MHKLSTTQTYIVKTVQGTEYGPADVNQLRIWAKEQRLNPTDSIHFLDGSPSIDAINCEQLASYFKGVTSSQNSDAIATLIPYKNKCALIGYYLGIVSLLPVIGLPFAIAALILGFLGLKHKNKHPESHGTAHAIVAIIGGISGLIISFISFALLPTIIQSN